MGAEPVPGPPQALAKELVGGAESRGSLRREVREPAGSENRKRKESGAAEGRGRGSCL